MGRRSIKLNYILNTMYQILILIVPLITTPYISRTLGANGIGIYSYTYAIISYFMLFAVMGTSTYAQRTIAYYQSDKIQRSVKFFEILSFRIITTFICVATYIVYLVSPICKYREVAFLQLIYLISVALDVSWLFQGMEDFKRIVLRNTVAKIFNVLLVFVLVKTSDDVWIYTIILAGMTLIANISIWPYVPQYIQRVPFGQLKPFGEIKEIISLFAPTIAVQVYAVLDKIMIGYIAVDAVENGYYEQTEKVVRMALAIVTALGTVMIPRIAQLFHDNNWEKIKSYLTKSYQFVWFLGVPIMCGLIGIANTFVPVFYGPGYERIEILLPIYSCLVVAVALSNVTGCQYLIPTKKQNVYTVAVGTSAIINLLLNLILIPRFLSVGAAVASVSAEIIGALIMLVYVQRNRMINIVNILKLSYKNWIAGFSMLIIVKWIGGMMSPSVMSLCMLLLLGVATYTLMLFVQKDKFFIDNCKMVIGKIVKK